MDLIEELQDDIQQERTMRIVREYGPKIILLAVLLVAVVAGYQLYDQYRTKQQQAVGDQLYAAIYALQEKNEDKGFEYLDPIMKDGYNSPEATLAALLKASYWMEHGEVGKAATLYEHVMNNGSGESLRSFAELMHLYTNVFFYDQGKRDKINFPENLDGNAWKDMIIWLRALHAMEKKAFDAAYQDFSLLVASAETSPIMKQSAARFVALIEAKQMQP